MSTPHSGSSLWAVTSYFNPGAYRSRRRNYALFRERLEVPLVTVELSTDGRFALDADDAEILLQCRSPSLLWHKERLLNLALGVLPDACREVAWVDCDVVFADPEWPQRTRDALARWRMVQPFRRLCDTPCELDPASPVAAWAGEWRTSYAACVAAGRSVAAVMPPGLALELAVTFGHAWAMRRDDLEAHGFYDAAVIGAGDKLMLAAALGMHELVAAEYHLSPAHRRHYLDWAARFHQTIAGSIGDVDGSLYHLWHGAPEHRGYRGRHATLGAQGFDPSRDLAQNADGSWRWSGGRPALEAAVGAYLLSRREDG